MKVEDFNPEDWKPRARMEGAERLAFEEFRASLEELGAYCMPCFDAGLPCYHKEGPEVAVLVPFLFEKDQEAE